MDVISALTSFALVAGVLTLTPGLDSALVLRAALTQGRRKAMVTGLGINTGAFLWGAAAAVGISALLTASQAAYTGLKIVGAAYMVWLGAGMIRKTVRRRTQGAAAEGADDGVRDAAPALGESGMRSWTRGLTTNLLNPKVGVFYVAVLPQFIPEGVPHLPMGLALAAVHALESVVWFAGLAYGTGLIRTWLQRPSVQRGIDRATGGVLVGFGINLAFSSSR